MFRPASALDDRALGAALAYAVDVKNAVVVAAAGNTGGAAECPPQQADATWETARVAVSPAWYDDYVLTVGSVNAEGAPSAFTLAGPWVDVAAHRRGGELSRVGPLSGTSYAAPVVSGLAALIRARFPTLDRAAGDAAHRVDRASSARRMGSVRRQRHGRRPGRGQHRLDPVSHVRAAHPTGRRSAPAPRSAQSRPSDAHVRAVAFGGAAIGLAALVLALASLRLGGPRRPRSTVSRATNAFALLSSGPAGNAASIGHGATAAGGQPEVVRRLVVVDREPHPGVGDEVSRADFGPLPRT